MRMIRIVAIEPIFQLCHDSFRIWPTNQLGIVQLQRLHKALCYAVTFRACHCVVTCFKPTCFAKLLVSAAVYQLPLSVSHSNVLAGLPFDLNRFSTACIIKSPTNLASMPLVVVSQLIISLSQQSSANTTLTRSPF